MNAKRRNNHGEFVIHVGAGFAAREWPHVRENLATLQSHLGRWDADTVSVEVTLQDRGRREQRVTLRTVLPGLPPVIAVAMEANVDRALTDAKHELIRQLEHQKVMREPMHSRRLSGKSIRHPSGIEPFGGRVN